MNTVQKSVLLIGNTKTTSVASLEREAKAQGLIFELISPADAVALYEGKISAESGVISRDIYAFDTYFFRGISAYIEELRPLVQELSKRDKRIVERFFAEHGSLPEDKLVPASELGLYKVPVSTVVNADSIHNLLPTLKFPLVVKKLGIGSSMGRMVSLVQTAEELETFCAATTGPLLLQDYYQIEYDTRVMVVGGKCLGGFDRFKFNSGDFITTRLGGSRDMTVLTSVQAAAAVEATKLQGLEIAGVDMFMSDNEIYIIEVNCSPQFKVFERCTGVNVAKEIIAHLIK